MTPQHPVTGPQPRAAEQAALPLADSRLGDPLFLAYSRSHLAELGITFEKARITPHLRLPLERTAAALKTTSHESPVTSHGEAQ